VFHEQQDVLASAAVAAAMIATVGTAASHDDDHGGRRGRRLRADLKGLRECPSSRAPVTGTFRAVINDDETQITYAWTTPPWRVP